jgi:dTDP-4-dehydrorhamnose 3,5-epimerase-like enzyme
METLIELEKIGNEEAGYLSLIEINRHIDFSIKRIFYNYGVPVGVKRGMHAHKKCKHVIWCPFGEIEIVLDNGFRKKDYVLDSPAKALVIPEGIWLTMVWKKEASVLCAAVSEYYDNEDYIRDYNEYLKHINEGYWENENKL